MELFNYNFFINNIKTNMLRRGFTNDDLEMLRTVFAKYQEIQTYRLQTYRTKSQYESAMNNLMNIPKLDRETLQCFNLNQNALARLKYTYSTAIGKVTIDNEYQLSAHYKKLNRNISGKIGISDLIASNLRDMPRKCVIAGIPNGPFSIYNSNNYKGADKLFEVAHATPSKVSIVTPIKPVIKHGQSHGIPDIINIVGFTHTRDKNGNSIEAVQVDVYKKFFRLCNRFIIVASLRQPEYHLGMYTMICREGSKVYVYAKNMGVAATPRYNGSTERVYDYGFFNGEILPKLKASAVRLYRKLNCVHQELIPANMQFEIIEPEKKVDEHGYDIVEEDEE